MKKKKRAPGRAENFLLRLISFPPLASRFSLLASKLLGMEVTHE